MISRKHSVWRRSAPRRPGSTAWSALAVLALSCGGRSSEDAPPTAASKPTADQSSPEEPNPHRREVRVTTSSIHELEVVDLEQVPAPPYSSPRVAAPHVLLRGKHLRLRDEWPITPDRGAISVQDGASYDSRVVEAKVIDLESGRVVATVDSVDYVYPDVGVALAWSKRRGQAWEVLVHGEDGHIVPLWHKSESEPRTIVLHPASGEGWLFEERRDRETEDTFVRYASWKDLRDPPPKPSTPIQGLLPTFDIHRPPGWYGPDLRNPVAVPVFVEPAYAPDECPKIEMLPAGHRCVSTDHFALVDGWRIDRDPEDRSLRASQDPAGEIQRLELGEYCVVSATSLQPPRALIACGDDPETLFVWSPSRTALVPNAVVQGSIGRARNTHVYMIARPDKGPEKQVSTTWVDLVEMRALRHHAVSNATPYAMDRYVIVEDPPDSNSLHVVDLPAAQVYPLPVSARGCARLGVHPVEFPWVAIRCHDAAERLKSVAVVDLEKHRVWRLPAVREMWLQPERSRVVGVIARGADTRVAAWTLK